MFDPKKSIKIISGALFDRESTWNSYLPEAGDWQKTLLQLTIPLIVISSLAAFLVSSITADNSLLGLFKPTLSSTLINMLVAVIAAGVVAAIFGSLSGVFGGKSSIALGLAATTLAFVPGYVGQVVTWLPWIGGLLAIGLSIFSLVLLWRIIPLYLQVPDGKRAAHYIVSLLASIVVMIIVSRVIMPTGYAELSDSPFANMAESMQSADEAGKPRTGAAGVVAELARTGEIMAAAAEDQYTPPADGKLSEQQVQTYLAHVQAAGVAYAEKVKMINELEADLNSDGDVSMTDISKMMQATTAGGGIATVEISAVKAGGGNWAEHQWIQQALVTAGRMKDANESTAHNYALFQKYEDAIMRGMTPPD